jgi:hypothetical protein
MWSIGSLLFVRVCLSMKVISVCLNDILKKKTYFLQSVQQIYKDARIYFKNSVS